MRVEAGAIDSGAGHVARRGGGAADGDCRGVAQRKESGVTYYDPHDDQRAALALLLVFALVALFYAWNAVTS